MTDTPDTRTTEDDLRAEIARLTAERDAAMAGVVKVKPLVFSDFKEGGCCGRPYSYQFFITEQRNGAFLCHHDTTVHETLADAQAHAQAAYTKLALVPDPEAVNALTAAQIRADALREAAAVAVKNRFEKVVGTVSAMGNWISTDIEKGILALLDQPAPVGSTAAQTARDARMRAEWREAVLQAANDMHPGAFGPDWIGRLHVVLARADTLTREAGE